MKIAIIGHKRIASRECDVEIVVEELQCDLAKKLLRSVYNKKRNNVSDKTIKTVFHKYEIVYIIMYKEVVQ